MDRVVDRFGPCLVDAVRAAATNSKSPLQALASRLEADANYALLDNVAAAVGASREDVSTTLDMMEHEAERRILRRLDILGVANHAVAAKIVRSLELVPLPERKDVGLLGILAEGGSGKTTLAERVHLAAIEVARVDRRAPLPLFLEAISVGSITAEINRVWAGAFDLATRGIDVVVDGLDEAGIDRGQGLVGELRSLINDPLSPIRRALVTARPLDFGLRAEETTSVSLLSEEQASAIVATVSEKSTFTVMTTAPLADAVRRPFFAIAAGVVLGEDSGLIYATPSRILAHIARRAVGSVSPDAMELLARAAAGSVEGHHGYVTLSSVARNFAEREALRTNRIIEVDPTGDKIRFPVALIAEWFAAEHLLNDPDLAGELVANPRPTRAVALSTAPCGRVARRERERVNPLDARGQNAGHVGMVAQPDRPVSHRNPWIAGRSCRAPATGRVHARVPRRVRRHRQGHCASQFATRHLRAGTSEPSVALDGSGGCPLRLGDEPVRRSGRDPRSAQGRKRPPREVDQAELVGHERAPRLDLASRAR